VIHLAQTVLCVWDGDGKGTDHRRPSGLPHSEAVVGYHMWWQPIMHATGCYWMQECCSMPLDRARSTFAVRSVCLHCLKHTLPFPPYPQTQTLPYTLASPLSDPHQGCPVALML
jgi:hypothetical protein